MADERPGFLWAEEAASLTDIDRSCPTCGDTALKRTICLSLPRTDPVWRLLRCAACGCGFYAETAIPDYGAPELIGSTAFYLQQGMGVAVFAAALARIRKPPGSVYVEIGCGFGLALDMAVRALGWQGRGMDPAVHAQVGRDLLGLDIDLAYFDPTTVADDSCDVVMASEVLEHLPDPVAFLRDIRRALKPDGIIVVTTPDVGAVHPPIDKQALTATLSVGSHLILHSAASLDGALRAAGFADVQVEAREWQLIAFASPAVLTLRDDPNRPGEIVTAYLAERAASRAEPDDLYFGFAGRAFFEAVRTSDWATAAAVWPRLDAALRDRYGIALDMIAAPPPAAADARFEDLSTIMPFNLTPMMLARAYQRLHEGEGRAVVAPRFTAIRDVCGPIWSTLSGRNLGDTLTEQILWLSRAEEVLCAAYAGAARVLPMMRALPESPRGAGRDDLRARVIVTLYNMERPFLAARIAKDAGLRAARHAGDLSLGRVAKACVYEGFYRTRQMLRAG